MFLYNRSGGECIGNSIGEISEMFENMKKNLGNVVDYEKLENTVTEKLGLGGYLKNPVSKFMRKGRNGVENLNTETYEQTKGKIYLMEETCREIFRGIYKKDFPRVRLDVLKNPMTGKNLELDGFNEELKIGFEFNGEQHYRYPNFTNCTEEEFKKTVMRDQLKLDLCDEAGIYLIVIPYTVKMQELRNFIIGQLPKK